LEQSPVDPSSVLGMDEVVRVYQRWFRSAPRGFAMLVCQGEPARREFLDRLRGRIKALRFVDLSREKDARALVESMASALESSELVVFFGFEEALAATPENARLLNFNRERLASSQARQLWVVGPIWRRAFLAWAYDLYSWFLPNNVMGTPAQEEALSEPHRSKSAEKTEPGPAPSIAARRSAKSLLARFERIYREHGDVTWDLLNGALEALCLAGAYPETEDLLENAQGLVSEIRHQWHDESPQGMRDLSVSLDNVGDVQQDLGRTDEALVSYEESLGISRRLLEAYGESPQALRDLSVSLNNVGDVQRDLGRRVEALVSYEESLGIRRRLLEAYGESPQALRDLSLSLGKVGDVQRDLGRRDEALVSYEESLGIRRRLLDAYGESPQALRDLSLSLGKVGDVQRDLGRRDEALVSYEESLGISRRLLDAYGESPQALRDLSVSLTKVGDVQLDLGRRDVALVSYEESLGIRRKLLDAYGESPQALRDLSVSLDSTGNVQRDLGRRDEALVSYEESLGIRRRLVDAYGESPQALQDLAITCGLLVELTGAEGPGGRHMLAEATHAVERAIQRYGKLPNLVEVQEWLKNLT